MFIEVIVLIHNREIMRPDRQMSIQGVPKLMYVYGYV